MKYLSFLFLLPFLIGCGPSNTIVVPEFSVRDSLKTAVVTVEVPGFDDLTAYCKVNVFWHPWHSPDQEVRELDLDTNGRVSFEVTENVIRSYNLFYCDSFLEFAVRPGEDVTVQLWPDTLNGGYLIKSPNAPFTEQAAEVIVLLTPSDWGTLMTQGMTDLDSILAFHEKIAVDRRQKLEKIWASGKYTDPRLLEYANSYIDHQVRYSFNSRVISEERYNQDSLMRRYFFRFTQQNFPELEAFNNNLITDLQYEGFAVSRLVYNATKHLPQPERHKAFYEQFVQLTDSLYEGYPHDFLLTRVYDLHLLVKDPAPTLITDVKHFVRTTPYPSFSVPLQKKLSILVGETSPIYRYEQQLVELPEGMDNPIPGILAEHAGKVIVLDFWATWCSPCIDEMKNDYPAFMKKYGPEQVAVVFLAQSSPENIWRDQVSKLKFSAIHLQTNKEQTSVVRKLFGISGIPHHAIFDQAGTLVQAKADGPGYGLEKLVDDLLGL